jgi:hypothetical protein
VSHSASSRVQVDLAGSVNHSWTVLDVLEHNSEVSAVL